MAPKRTVAAMLAGVGVVAIVCVVVNSGSARADVLKQDVVIDYGSKFEHWDSTVIGPENSPLLAPKIFYGAVVITDHHPPANTCVTDFCAFGGDCVKCLPNCGDGTCDPGDPVTGAGKEDCSSCASDCGICLNHCGNGVCGPGESSGNCSVDCGVRAGFLSCGDGTCDPKENCGNCYTDCGTCVAACGSGTCGSGKDCSNCVADCGHCDAGDPPGQSLTCPVP